MEGRNRNIDGIKGFLVVLVVLGHVLQGKLDQHFGRYVIYGFHMPIFIALAGYLFSLGKSKGESLNVFLGKYRMRVLVPWLFAMLVYAIYLGAFGDARPEWKGWLAYVLNPYYHLWFVPGYLFWCFLVWLILKFSDRRELVFLFGALLAIGFYYFQSIDAFSMLGKNLGDFVMHVLRPHYFFFFALGIYARGESEAFLLRDSKKGLTPQWVFVVSGLGLYFLHWALFYFHVGISKVMWDTVWIFGNVFFILALFRWMYADIMPKSKFLEWVGQQSMGVYLWHVLPLLLMKEWLGIRLLERFYLGVFVAEAAFLFLIYLLSRYFRGAKYILGNR